MSNDVEEIVDRIMGAMTIHGGTTKDMLVLLIEELDKRYAPNPTESAEDELGSNDENT